MQPILITIKKAIALLSLLIAFLLSGCAGMQSIPQAQQPNQELVILAHGLGRSDFSMWLFTLRLEHAGYQVCALDYDSIGESLDSVLATTASQISNCMANSMKIHFIGHSLGGLVIRSYLQNNRSFLNGDRMGEVVLIGTPNKGSELADYYQDSWVMDVAGSVTKALVTGNKSLGNQLDEVPVNIGVIAGTKSSMLTNGVFSGPNDGLVSVESTKLKSMSDFISIDSGHAYLRYHRDVAKQSIHFLQFGTFKHFSAD